MSRELKDIVIKQFCSPMADPSDILVFVNEASSSPPGRVTMVVPNLPDLKAFFSSAIINRLQIVIFAIGWKASFSSAIINPSQIVNLSP